MLQAMSSMRREQAGGQEGNSSEQLDPRDDQLDHPLAAGSPVRIDRPGGNSDREICGPEGMAKGTAGIVTG